MIDANPLSPRSAHPGAPGSIVDSAGEQVSLQTIWSALETVTDPEIPVINVVEMGIIAAVRVVNHCVEVDVTPTFAGCPAIATIREDIRLALLQIGAENANVKVVYDPPWSSERMTAEGRRKLKEFGLAPPGPRCTGSTPDIGQIACPYCNSVNTDLESIFGPTLCRSIHYCHSCLQSFEHFKTV